MKLSEFVATGDDAPEDLKKPFYFLDANKVRWAAACDEKTLFLINAKVKLPKLKGEGVARMGAWAAAVVTEPQATTADELREWTGSVEGKERKGLVLGIQIDKDRLAKIVAPLKGDLTLWDASKVVGIPCLGLLAKSGLVRVLLAGYEGPEKGIESFTPSPTETDLFDIAMDL